ncbi:TLC domain-containing protein [Melia azedarach]|nr:TLC domain-containing protein [Melia azedarach]
METFNLYSLNTPTFFLMFILIYLFAYFVVFHNWGPKHRAEASSCFISLAHGTPAVFMAGYATLNTQKSLRTLASPNTIFQNFVLEYSIAYFLMDLLHYIIFLPRDVLFILHHVATLYVLVTCRYAVHYGAFEILVILILAEVTSACQNVWSLASFRKADVPASAKLHELLSPPFYTFYSVVRGIMGPLFVYKMWVFYLSGAADHSIPKWARVSWMIVIIAGVLLSILWILNNWIGWYRELSYRAGKKVR